MTTQEETKRKEGDNEMKRLTVTLTIFVLLLGASWYAGEDLTERSGYHAMLVLISAYIAFVMSFMWS